MNREAMPELLRAAGVTARELETFWLVADRLQNDEIAVRLHVSKRTVESHVSSLLRKLDASTRMDLIQTGSQLREQVASTAGALPTQLTSFVGRTRELASLAELVASHRLVTLTGPAGAGKTRLALQLARTIGTGSADLVDLASVPSDAGVERAFAEALGIDAGGQPVRAALRDVLAAAPRWLLVDNCEHVESAVADVVAHLLAHASGLTVLATSHGPLRVPGEVVFDVPTLDVPGPDASPAEVFGTAAGRLFADRAATAAPGFAITAENAGEVAEVCRRLDGLPLAIELAAARVRIFSPAELLVRLRDRFAILTDGSRGSGRHRTLEQALRWSYDLLEERERLLLDRLSVFPGAFDYDTATHVVTQDPLSASSFATLFPRLLDRSLVAPRRFGQTTEYRLLDSIRQFAHRQLVARDAAASVRAAHGRHLLARGTALGAELRGPSHSSARAWFQRRWADLGAAVAWAFERDEYDLVWTFLGSVSIGWQIVGNRGELYSWLSVLTQRPLPVGSLGVRAGASASFLMSFQDAGLALSYASYVSAQAVGPDEVALGHLTVGAALARGGSSDRPAAVEHLRAAEDAFQALGDEWHYGFALSMRGLVELDPLVRHDIYTRAVALWSRLDVPSRRANALFHLANNAIESGIHAGAVTSWLAEAREHALAAGNRHEWLHAEMLSAFVDQGDSADSFASLLVEFRRIGDRRCAARCLHGLGIAATRSGSFEAGRGYLSEAISLTLEAGPAHRVVDGLRLLADLEYAAGFPSRATELLDECASREDAFAVRTRAIEERLRVALQRSESPPAF